MKRKKIALILAICMAAGTCMYGCGQEEAELEDEIVEVEVVSPSTGDIAVATEFMGTLEPQEEVNVFSKMSGEVTNTYFEVGDRVEAGEVLFTIDDKAAQLQVQGAQAAYDTAAAGVDQQLGALELNRASAEDKAATAGEGIQQIEGNYGYMNDQYNDAQEKIDDLEEDKHDLEHDKKKVKSKLRDAKDALEAAQAAAKSAEDDYNAAVAAGAPQEQIDSFLAAKEAADANVAAAQSAVNTLRSSRDSLEKGIDSLDDAIDAAESGQKTIGHNMDNLGYSYSQAKRGANLAQQNLDFYNQHTAPDTVKSADASLRSASVAVGNAKLNLDNTKITAPISGVIEEKKVDKYDMAQAGATAYVVTNKDTMMVKFYVTESVYRELVFDQPVIVERNGVEYTGHISDIPVALDSGTGLFEIKAIVDGTAAELVNGASAKVKTVTSHAENVSVIPVDCVYYDSTDAYIYTVSGGVVSKQYVEVGIFDDDNIQIITELAPDAKIVSTWSADLRDGLNVTAVDAKPASN